jgi:uncharacterized protein
MSQAAAGSHSSRSSARPALVSGRLWLGAEWFTLFAVFPTLIALKLIPLHILLILIIAATFCLALLILDPAFDRKQLWNVRGAARGVHRIVITFVVLGILMALGVAMMTPDRLLYLVRERPELWAMIMIGYPIFSVYPQEVIFRTFMFHRYRRLFTDPRIMVLMSGLAFGYAHIFFENQIAVIMTIIGGLLFAWTYEKTRSTFAVWLEHGLYGCFIFTIGLGIYFFSGAIGSV